MGCPVRKVVVAPDGMSVRIASVCLREGYVHEVKASGVRSANGAAPLLHATAYYTLNRIPDGDRIIPIEPNEAELCVVPEPQCLPVPDGLDPIAAAAIPETYFTVWTNLFQRARLQRGERVLVHGGTSGIGTTAIQLAREWNATVFATAGSDEKCAACERLGAQAINYKTSDFVEVVRASTAGLGVDVILDIIGGEYLSRNLDCLAMEGRLVQIGLQGGARAEINLSTLMQRRATLIGSTLRPRSPEQKGLIARDLEQHVWPLLAVKRVGPVVHATFPLEQAAAAHRLLESGDVIGKVVLIVSEIA